MTAVVPARTPKARVMRHVRTASPFDGLTVVVFTVAEGRREDEYVAAHWRDSNEVRVCHAADPSRAYRVVCSASTGKPLVCECRDNLYRGGSCKHMSAVAKLTEMGLLEFAAMEDSGVDRGHGCE